MAPLALAQLIANTSSRVFPAEPSQPVLVHGVVPFQVQDISLLLAELCEVLVSPLLQCLRSL